MDLSLLDSNIHELTPFRALTLGNTRRVRTSLVKIEEVEYKMRGLRARTNIKNPIVGISNGFQDDLEHFAKPRV